MEEEMKKVIMMSLCLIAACGCSSGSHSALPFKRSSSSLAEFKAVKVGMTEVEVGRIVGKPTRLAGSGIAYDVYDLLDGSSVWIALQKGQVSWLLHQDKEGRRAPLNQRIESIR